MIRRTVTFLLILITVQTYCQQPPPAEDSKFRVSTLPRLLLEELNRFRVEKGLDTLEIYPLLNTVAEMSSTDMADEESEKTTDVTSQKYLLAGGATKKGKELTMKAVINKGREDFKTSEIAKVIYNRWENNEKNVAILLDPQYRLCGISASMDEVGEKVYVSMFFGGFDITNEGVLHKKQMAVPYNSAPSKLKAPDARGCITCERWRNYDQLHQGIFVRDGKIYMRYSNSRDLRRILRRENDGFAVDVVQREQFNSPYYNIIDNNQLNKGIMSKVIYKDKLFEKNLLITKDKKANRKVKGLEVEFGKLNPKITGPYEINLVVIQNDKVCKTITRGYTENNTVSSNTPLGLIPMKNTSGLKPVFEPRNESSILNFVIPFLKNKSEFKQEDIQPFLDALHEPKFNIDGLYIYAYSSIEGDSLANLKLQQKRAESVVTVLQTMQTSKITPTILYRDSWGLFLLENEDGKYADIVNLGKQKAIDRINSDKKLLDELEPILARERFAQIIMDVTYDVSGDKEQNFVKTSFNKAALAGNTTQANKILDFVSRRVSEGKYTLDFFDSLEVPVTDKLIGLANNRLYHQYTLTNQIDEDDAALIEKLLALKPKEPVLIYNDVFCKLKLDSNAASSERQTQVQQRIDALYGQIDSSLVNGLNIEWQFRIMESMDTLANSDAVIDACIARIKSFYNIKEATWQNALKLSEVFVRAKDYNNAANVLEPYLDHPQVSENLLYMYICTASRIKEKYYSRKFSKALEIAQARNPDRYCKLFGAPFMTFQVLENPDVKRKFQLSCGSK